MYLRRVRWAGLDTGHARRFLVVGIAGAFLMAHVVKLLAYAPGQVAADPLALFRVFDGLSSFGGYLGVTLVVLMWRLPVKMQYVNAAAYATPTAWALVRAGCALAHDHIGIRSSHWLAVAYPGGPRFNLGLIEMLFSAVVAVLFILTGRRPWPAGLYSGAFSVLFGTFRWWMDGLQETTPRYAGLSPDRIGAALLVVVGVAAFWKTPSPPGKRLV